MLEGVSSRVPYHVNLGNHEYDYPGRAREAALGGCAPAWACGWDSGGECGVPTFARFHMPRGGGGRPGGGGGSGLAPVTRADGVTERGVAYSVDYGLVHFVMFSTEHAFGAGSPQRAWLEKDLAAVDRAKTPWVLTGGHRPMYSSSYGYGVTEAHADACRDGSYDAKRFNCQDVAERDALEPLFRRHGVDLALWGHTHTYERACGIAGNFTCAEGGDSAGTAHISTGAAGNVYNPDWQGLLPMSPKGLSDCEGPCWTHHDMPAWQVFRTMSPGYTRVRANATALTVEFVGTQRGEVHDTLRLRK